MKLIIAEDLETEEELFRLRQNLDQQLLQLKSFISKLANKLQRKLLAKQNRSWDFDLGRRYFRHLKTFKNYN